MAFHFPRRFFARSLNRNSCSAAALMLALMAGGASTSAQTWTRITNNPPGAVNLMLLLSDGTVMGFNNNGSTIGRACYRLTPNAAGSYVGGTWSALASMVDTRLYYTSQVLMDGRVFVAGGEYGTGTARAELYNPQTNTWTQVNPPISLLDPSQPSAISSTTQRFYDSNSEMLPDGRVLIAPVLPKVAGQPLIYSPATNSWAAGPHYFRGVYQDEASWVKLPDDSILTVDPFGTLSERYIPSLNTWVNDGVVPVSLYDPFGSELGGAVMLANGKAFYLGSIGHTALYTPSGTTAPGVWTAGPDIPAAHGTPDAPCAVMVNGKVLCAVSPLPTSANHFPPPTTFYEYDPVANSFAAVGTPTGGVMNQATYIAQMLALPNGQIMFSHMGTDVYVYTPAGAPLAAGKPSITTITANGDGSFHLVGLGLNGISAGATYGDDCQMNSNYPIVRVHHSNGNVYYARTYNWSSIGVMTGATPVSTEYRLPVSMPAGAYTLVVSANGNASDPATGASVATDPVSISACASGAGSASFTVVAGGTGSFAYQWRRGTTPLTNAGNITGADAATLFINPVGPGDLGNDYNCVVSNALGSATSASVSLTTCYANCDCSATPPTLNVNDFSCFLNKYAAGDPYANCDSSTTPPVLNVLDFSCFLNTFAAGCP